MLQSGSPPGVGPLYTLRVCNLLRRFVGLETQRRGARLDSYQRFAPADPSWLSFAGGLKEW